MAAFTIGIGVGLSADVTHAVTTAPGTMLRVAVATPMALGFAVASLVPGLYIGLALVGQQMSLQHTVDAARGTWEDAGIALLGLTPVYSLLVSAWGTGPVVWMNVLLGLFTLLVLQLVAVRGISRRLLSGGDTSRRRLGVALVYGWSFAVFAVFCTLFSRLADLA